MTHIVSLSGGMDSTAALYDAIQRHPETSVTAISIYYGQRHEVELEHAQDIARELSVEWRLLDLSGLLHGSALLDGSPVPHGHYAEDTMAATVVNGRNLLFGAALIAQTQPGDTVVLGVHAGDHPVYKDCRPEFIHGLRACASAYDVRIRAPWLHLTKDQIIAHAPGAPFELSWSCYEGGETHCGRCGTCVERAEAFHLAGVPDPTTYADSTFWREQVGV